MRCGLTLERPGLSPSLPQPQACNPVRLQPWGWGGLSLMAQSWAWVGTTPPQRSQAHPGGGGTKRPDPKSPCYGLGCLLELYSDLFVFFFCFSLNCKSH